MSGDRISCSTWAAPPGRGVPGVHFLDLHRRRRADMRSLRATLTLLLLLLGQ